MSRINDNLKADIKAFFGASGSGKTYSMLKSVPPGKRALAFDPAGSVTSTDKSFKGVTSWREFMALSKQRGNIRIAYQAPGKANFEKWCKWVFALADARQECYLIVDELSGVTSPAKAPEHWNNIINLGRKFGLKIRAGAQRPPEIDKTLIGNHNGIWIGHMARTGDAEYLAKETDIHVQEILKLRSSPYHDCIMFERRGVYKAHIAKRPVT